MFAHGQDQFLWRSDDPPTEKEILQWIKIVQEVIPGLIDMDYRKMDSPVNGKDKISEKKDTIDKEEAENKENNLVMELKSLKIKLMEKDAKLTEMNAFYSQRLKEERKNYEHQLKVNKWQMESMNKRINMLYAENDDLRRSAKLGGRGKRDFSPPEEDNRNANHNHHNNQNHGSSGSGNINTVQSIRGRSHYGQHNNVVDKELERVEQAKDLRNKQTGRNMRW